MDTFALICMSNMSKYVKKAQQYEKNMSYVSSHWVMNDMNYANDGIFSIQNGEIPLKKLSSSHYCGSLNISIVKQLNV